jgi:hypothetical protein
MVMKVAKNVTVTDTQEKNQIMISAVRKLYELYIQFESVLTNDAKNCDEHADQHSEDPCPHAGNGSVIP